MGSWDGPPEDELAPTRGCLVGLGLGLLLWAAVVALLVCTLTRWC